VCRQCPVSRRREFWEFESLHSPQNNPPSPEKEQSGKTLGTGSYGKEMIERELSVAQSELNELIELVEEGEEIILTRDGHPVARIISFNRRSQPREVEQA